MSRTAVVTVVAVVATLGVVVIVALVWRPFDGGPIIQGAALGVWQEATPAEPMRLTISAGGPRSGENEFWVTFASPSEPPLPARLEGDTIVVRGEDTQDVVWVISYDEGAEALLVGRPDGRERHILRRISE